MENIVRNNIKINAGIACKDNANEANPHPNACMPQLAANGVIKSKTIILSWCMFLLLLYACKAQFYHNENGMPRPLKENMFSYAKKKSICRTLY
jgi:hypothetical protein